jgi:hypothetical protein
MIRLLSALVAGATAITSPESCIDITSIFELNLDTFTGAVWNEEQPRVKLSCPNLSLQFVGLLMSQLA